MFEFEITLISPFDQRETPENIKLVKLQGATESFLYGNFLNLLEMRNLSALEMLKERSQIGGSMAEFMLSHEKTKELLNSGEKFDVFIYDAYYNDALLGYVISKYFKFYKRSFINYVHKKCDFSTPFSHKIFIKNFPFV